MCRIALASPATVYQDVHKLRAGTAAIFEAGTLRIHRYWRPAFNEQPVAFANDVGWAKVPDVIGYAHRVTLSWDASGEGPIDLLAVEADIAAGVRVKWLEEHPFQGASLGAYLNTRIKPRYPFTRL